MHRVLKARREEIKKLRADRDMIKADRTELYNNAVEVNVQIDEIRKDLEKMYEARKKQTAEISKRLLERKMLSDTISLRLKDIKVKKDMKRTMFNICREKKSVILDKDKAILKAQDDIKSLKGNHKDW